MGVAFRRDRDIIAAWVKEDWRTNRTVVWLIWTMTALVVLWLRLYFVGFYFGAVGDSIWTHVAYGFPAMKALPLVVLGPLVVAVMVAATAHLATHRRLIAAALLGDSPGIDLPTTTWSR